MKKIAAVLLVILWCVGFSAHAQENSLPARPHLLVKGQAERTVTPDRFTINVTLQRVDLAPAQARVLVQQDAARILGAFKKHHALEGSIDASSLTIRPSYGYEDNRQVFKGTQVTRTLAATFVKLEDARGFLGDVQTSEHVQIASLTTEYSAAGELRAQLKQEAAAQSRSSAQGLAKAYGTRITGLYTISDVAPSFAYGVQAGVWPGDPRVPPPAPAPAADFGASVGYSANQQAESLEAGTLTITENVYAIYLIAQ